MYDNSSKTIEYQLDLPPQKRLDFLAECNAALQTARDSQSDYIHRREGREAAKALSDAVDEILISMCNWLCENARLDKDLVNRIAIVAQGGYGRARMNPYSDIDLLILMPDRPRPAEQAFVKSLLYLLWDLHKVELGHATKRVGEATNCVGHDLDSTTALLNLRLIYGSRAMVKKVSDRVASLVRGHAKKWFVESKLMESRNRKAKYGSSIYLLEPNVKDGEGGLRDIHSIRWLSYAILKSENLKMLVTRKALRAEELQELYNSADFLLSVRTALHLAEGRKIDLLAFNKQPIVAKDLGYESDPVLLAEEKMMKDYYLHARFIDRYSQKAARLITAKSKTKASGIIEAMRRRSLNEIYYVKSGLMFQQKPSGEYFCEDPVRIMAAFHTAVMAGAMLSEDLKQAIEECGHASDTDEFRTSTRCRDLFMEIMSQKSGAGPTLHAMHETGILANYMPEFRKLFCLVRIDHYHRYTVDEHLIKAVYELEDLYQTGAGQRPELVDECREISRYDLMNLSLLLHDIGKGEGHGHVLRGAIISQKMTQRMGLPTEDQEIVRQLILQHLKMVHISQRRDLEDPNVIKEMAGTVPNLELLRMLYILTYCDIRAVGPGIWSDWKGMLLYDLYRKTVMLLEGHNPIQPMDDTALKQLLADIGAKAKGTLTAAEIAQFVNNASAKYLATLPPSRIVHHIILQKASTDENPMAWHVYEPKDMNYTEITAVGPDVRGLLSMLCGALSSKDINILSMQAFSTKDGYAIDIFQVTDLRGNKLPQGFRLDRLRKSVNNVLHKRKTIEEAFQIRERPKTPERDATVVKPAEIIMENDDSPDYTIFEVKSFDRPALLYDITRICNEQAYYIHLAMIITEAYRVVDVFYITDLEFNKLSHAQAKKLVAALEQSLTDDSGELE